MLSPVQRRWPRQPLRPVAAWIYLLPFAAIILFTFFFSGCERADLPSTPGDYPIENNDIRFDGQDYIFRWIDRDQRAHRVETEDVKLVQDAGTFLRVNGGAVLHLAESQRIQVDARDDRGNYGTSWYPFLWGPMGGGPVVVPPGSGGDPRVPTYRYPPTDRFGRDETLGGSVPASKPKPPDYTNVPNARDTVGGQSGGTGGGAAATGRVDRPSSGQSGGTGGGSAASSKGGFRTGPSAYSESRSPSNPSTGGKSSSSSPSQPRVGAGGAGSSGGLQSPKAGSGARSAPARPPSGSKGISGARR
jgi:hypothetical protein